MVVVAALLVPALAAAQVVDANKSLYDQHFLPELRDAIQAKDAPALYRGAVASAFNDTKGAEKYFNLAIQHAPKSDTANEAHSQLAYLYARLGRNREVVQQFDRMLEIKPRAADVQEMREMFAAFSRYPDQSVGKKRSTVVRAGTVSKEGLTIPASINGKAVRWIVDSGANFSVVSESEARMLGLVIGDQQSQTHDGAGGTASVRTTVVHRLMIGEVELRNVPFMVLPDSQPPMNSLPSGERGLLGLPVLIALQTIAWTSDGTFEIGFPSAPKDSKHADLWFSGLSPEIQVNFQAKTLDFLLDTGNGACTQLWSRFAKDFSSLVKEQGKKSMNKVTQMGGSNEREVIALPELQFQVGGMNTLLKPAQVFSKPVGNDSQYGNLGMDLLSQAREVRIDFRAMTIALLP